MAYSSYGYHNPSYATGPAAAPYNYASAPPPPSPYYSTQYATQQQQPPLPQQTQQGSNMYYGGVANPYAGPSSSNGNFYYDPRQQQALMAAYQRPPTLREWFDSVDTDRSGAIDAHELVNALRKGRINISPQGAAKLIALFDSRGTRQIDFEQFKAMHPFIDAMTRGFKKRDISGDGFLQIDEVNSALIDSGHRISTGCLQTLMMKFDSGRRGKLSFDDYVDLSIFIAAVKNTFASFDRRGVGQVEMDFNQFVTACIIVK